MKSFNIYIDIDIDINIYIISVNGINKDTDTKLGY